MSGFPDIIRKLTPAKAEKEFGFMLPETAGSEECVAQDQQLMGDASFELREAYGVPRNAVANQLGMDSMQVAELERQCSSEMAKKYRAAVQKLAPFYKKRPPDPGRRPSP